VTHRWWRVDGGARTDERTDGDATRRSDCGMMRDVRVVDDVDVSRRRARSVGRVDVCVCVRVREEEDARARGGG